jgi:hypothetical protein
MTSNSELNGAISDVVQGLLNASRQEALQAALALMEDVAIQKALMLANEGDMAGFEQTLLRPMEKTIEGVLHLAVPNNHPVQFLLRHYGFISRHFRSIIEKREGNTCCADKTRFIMRSLMKFYQTGAEIQLNREQQYIFHLPTVVFTTHDAIVAFFEAVQALHYGEGAKYLKQMALLTVPAATEAIPAGLVD